MKKIIINIFFALILIAGVSGCRKDTNDVTPMRQTDMAYVQWINATLNSSRNFIYVNGVPANGTSVAYGGVFPASSFAFGLGYGTNTLLVKDTLSTTTQAQQTLTQYFDPNASYTLFTYDTITAPKRVLVQNDLNYPTNNAARIRFINLIYNPTTAPNVDLYSVNAGSNLFSNVPLAQVTSYMSLQPGVADTWQVRLASLPTVLATLSVTSTSLIPNKNYTVVFRGSYRAVANRSLSIVSNQ